MGSHPLPVPPPLHHYRILIHHLPHRGSRHHSASASSRHRFHFRILTAPVPMTWLQESAVTVNTVDTTGRARQLAAVHPSRCRAGRVRRAEPLFREATDSHASAWDVLRPYGTTATPSVWRMAPTRSLPAGVRCTPACRPSPPSAAWLLMMEARHHLHGVQARDRTPYGRPQDCVARWIPRGGIMGACGCSPCR